MPRKALLLTVVLSLSLTVSAGAQAPVTYRVSFPQPEHRFAQVEVTFPEAGSAPLEVRMSRSSPGRYALHEFARNVFDVRAFDGNGQPLTFDRPDAHQWTVLRHNGTVRMQYRVHGDQVDGTFLAVDATHAHHNMPATLMWARGLEDRPVRITFDVEEGEHDPWIGHARDHQARAEEKPGGEADRDLHDRPPYRTTDTTIIATAMNVAQPTIERRDSRPTPQTPCPLVQPPP